MRLPDKESGLSRLARNLEALPNNVVKLRKVFSQTGLASASGILLHAHSPVVRDAFRISTALNAHPRVRMPYSAMVPKIRSTPSTGVSVW